MEGFKPFKKVQCFKEGGSVQKQIENFTKRDRKSVEPADTAEDKAIVKKAFGQHDKAKHGGSEPTEIKLKKGGRAKKETGTVKKYKTGGSVDNEYSAKKASGDLDRIAKVKDIKPGKAAAPSKASVKPNFFGSDVAKEKSKPAGHKDPYIKSKQSGKAAAAPSGAKGPDKFKCGGKVVKKADGGIMDAIGNVGTQLKNNVMGTPEQNRIAQAQMDKVKARKAAEAAALMQGQGGAGALQQGALAGGVVPMPSAPQGPQTAPMPQPSVAPQGVGAGLTPMKKGGKVKKACK